jgi:hypothetical protein
MTNDLKPELSPEVLAGIEAASRAQKELEQIDAAIAATNNELSAAKSTMDAAREALAGAEAKAALEGGGADKPARRALVVARDDHEFLVARLEGLQARRKAAVDTLARARHGAAVSYRAWQRQQAQQFVEHVYLPAMEQFVAVIRMATGVGSALESHMLTAIGRDTVLRNPGDWERNPASARRTDWQSDPIYLRLTELAALMRPHLGEEVNDRTAQEDSGAAA